jgi:hypothetical protein
MINQGVTAPYREAFEEWFNAFNIKEMPEYQTIRDFSFAAWQAATAAKEAEIAAIKAEQDASPATQKTSEYLGDEKAVTGSAAVYSTVPINRWAARVRAAIAKTEGSKE